MQQYFCLYAYVYVIVPCSTYIHSTRAAIANCEEYLADTTTSGEIPHGDPWPCVRSAKFPLDLWQV